MELQEKQACWIVASILQLQQTHLYISAGKIWLVVRVELCREQTISAIDSRYISK